MLADVSLVILFITWYGFYSDSLHFEEMLRNAPVCLAVHFLLVLARLSSRQGSSTHMLLQTGFTAILYSRGGLHILSVL